MSLVCNKINKLNFLFKSALKNKIKTINLNSFDDNKNSFYELVANNLNIALHTYNNLNLANTKPETIQFKNYLKLKINENIKGEFNFPSDTLIKIFKSILYF